MMSSLIIGNIGLEGKQQNEKLYNLYFTRCLYGNEIKEDKLCGTCSTQRKIINLYKMLSGSAGRRPLARPSGRLENILKCALKKYDAKLWSGFRWLRKGSSENGIEP
jgi:hypothetical protein